MLRQFFRFGCGFNRRWQFQLGLFRSAMVAMLQRLDAGSFFFHPQLSVPTFLALILKVCRNRFSCHSPLVWQKPVQAVQFSPLQLGRPGGGGPQTEALGFCVA